MTQILKFFILIQKLLKEIDCFENKFAIKLVKKKQQHFPGTTL